MRLRIVVESTTRSQVLARFGSTLLARISNAEVRSCPLADRLTVLVIEPRRLAQSHLRNPERCSLEIRGVGARN
jgi:hypothetical protein